MRLLKREKTYSTSDTNSTTSMQYELYNMSKAYTDKENSIQSSMI